MEHGPIKLLAVVIGGLFSIPGLFVFFRTIQLGSDFGTIIGQTWGPLGRTLLLASTVSLTAACLGTTLAWLVVRTDLPGRGMWRVALVLPLVLPSFVGAAAFLSALAPSGVLTELLGLISLDRPIRLRGFFPAWFVLSIFTYPYVLLPVAARLLSLRPSLEESSRLLGHSAMSTFVRVTLPQLRPAVLAGSLLVFLYSVSDFGAVQLLGYDTLTRVVFATMLVARGVSFTSAAMLILLAVSVVIAERVARAGAATDVKARSAVLVPDKLGLWKIPALGLCCAVVGLGLVVPILSLATWGLRGLLDQRVDVTALLWPAINTATVGVITAVTAVAVVVPIAVLTIRYRSHLANASSIAVIGGFAVPGVVIAISLVSWVNTVPGMSAFYQTLPLLIVAYIIHFGSQAMGAAENAVRSVPDPLRESARLLNPSRSHNFRLVDLPLMRPSLASGAGLVLLSTIKELPTTLILSPLGFSTLATKIWGSYEDGYYAEVGVTSIMLIALSAMLTWTLVLRRTDVIQATTKKSS